jgi:hypothetical protein
VDQIQFAPAHLFGMALVFQNVSGGLAVQAFRVPVEDGGLSRRCLAATSRYIRDACSRKADLSGFTRSIFSSSSPGSVTDALTFIRAGEAQLL